MKSFTDFFAHTGLNFYGFIIFLAVLSGWLLARSRSALYKISKDDVDDGLLFLVPASIVGARLYHVIDRWDLYKNDPIQILAIWQGGLGIFGAIIFGLITLLILCKIKKINLLSVLDLSAGSFVLAQAIGRIGNFTNLEAYGQPTSLPWKIYIPASHRPSLYAESQFFHPTFFYDLLWNLILFLIITIFISKKIAKFPGVTFALYAIFYSFGRILIEFFRFDTWSINSIKVAQMLSVVIFLFSMILLFKLILKYKLK